MNDLVAFDLNQLQVPTNRWEMLIRNTDEGGPPQGQVPPARTNHSVVTYNDKLYLFGGTNGLQWFNDVWTYDPTTNSWSQLDCIGYIPAPREGHAAALVDDVMYIFGGRTEEGTDLGDLAAFRISSRRWYTFQNMGPSPSPRSGHSMTAYNKHIVILAGEPSTLSREAQDLTLAYVLDTTKIRYPPNDGQPTTGARRPSVTDRNGVGPNRGPRDGSNLPGPKRLNSVPPREPMVGHTSSGRPGAPGVNGNDANGIAPGSAQPQGAPGPSPTSKLPQPRVSLMQQPTGPPPQQQAPPPNSRINGPQGSPGPNPGMRGKSARAEKGFGPAVDISLGRTHPEREPLTNSPNSRNMSPARESPVTKESPVVNGRRTPTTTTTAAQQAARTTSRQDVVEPPSVADIPQSAVRSNSKTRQQRQQSSVDSNAEQTSRSVANRPSSPPPPTRHGSNSINRRSSARNSQSLTLLKELETMRGQMAWYASELELAKKAGYVPNVINSPILDRASAESFGEADRPLIEALISMRTELGNVQSSIDQQAILAAKKIAEVEKQRDAAVSEAVYAKARLAAHGGSQSSTPQLDNDSDLGRMSADRSNDISRKLASALAAQKELENQVSLLRTEVEAEKRSRQLAEDTANAVQLRLTDLESYKQQNASEVESLRAELHQAQVNEREHATVSAEASASTQLLQVERDDLEKRYQELLESTKDHGETFESLRNALTSSADMKSLLERKLSEERDEREVIEEKLQRLRSEHENMTAELEVANRKLRDAEELAEKHADEARMHHQAVLSGLEKISSREVTSSDVGSDRNAILHAQVEAANALVRRYQEAADTASEKLRGAEERIAGLEAYQEQASREGLSIRKQLQAALRETQSLQASNSEIKHLLANQQLETNAVHVQHNTLKDILVERGISPSALAARRSSRVLNSPQLRGDTPDTVRVKELEQQIAALQQAHEDTKQASATREQEAHAAYSEKLSQLENDYQSAVHYVKGTEKMLKRMKEELARHKSDNARMKNDLEEAESRASSAAPTDWESERETLRKRIESLQSELEDSQGTMEVRLSSIKHDLEESQRERDHYAKKYEEAQSQLANSAEQARAELAQLQQENALLENRAMDAEHKVSLLLDQVESSVDSYRRQSRQLGGFEHRAPSGAGHSRNASATESFVTESDYTATGADRNSMALDSLASELETLRNHWETTNKNYRLSHNFDFERSSAHRASLMGGGLNPRIDEEESGLQHSVLDTKAGDNLELSLSLADWRKRLDEEEEEAKGRKGSVGSKEGKTTVGEMI